MSRRVQQCPVVVGRRQQTHCAPSGRSRVRIAAWKAGVTSRVAASKSSARNARTRITLGEPPANTCRSDPQSAFLPQLP